MNVFHRLMNGNKNSITMYKEITLMKEVKYSWFVRHLICLEFSFRICNITYRYSGVTVEKSEKFQRGELIVGEQ